MEAARATKCMGSRRINHITVMVYDATVPDVPRARLIFGFFRIISPVVTGVSAIFWGYFVYCSVFYYSNYVYICDNHLKRSFNDNNILDTFYE